ncbi:hypothetical protein MX850_08135 [Erysipelothrix sp. Poltava]|nr:hypothetical protein MX850_08135 [Erysipelothrix sp. Poltava]
MTRNTTIVLCFVLFFVALLFTNRSCVSSSIEIDWNWWIKWKKKMVCC